MIALSIAGCASRGPDSGLDVPVMPPAASARPLAHAVPDDYVPPVAEAWPDAVLLKNDAVEAVVVPSIGRLVHLAPRGGRNVYRCEAGLLGQVPSKKKGETFFNIGGDWLWPVSQARWPEFPGQEGDWPPPKALRDEAWTVSGDADSSITLTRTYGEPVNATVSRTFALCKPEPSTAGVVIQQSVTRTAPSDFPVTLWNISQIDSPTALVLPVAPRSAFENGIKLLAGAEPPPGCLSFLAPENAAVYRIAPGAEIKLGTDAGENAGAIAAMRGGRLTSLLALDPVGVPPGAAYPDGGCSHEAYSNHGLGYAEIETLSREVPLRPGETLSNRLVIRIDVP